MFIRIIYEQRWPFSSIVNLCSLSIEREEHFVHLRLNSWNPARTGNTQRGGRSVLFRLHRVLFIASRKIRYVPSLPCTAFIRRALLRVDLCFSLDEDFVKLREGTFVPSLLLG